MKTQTKSSLSISEQLWLYEGSSMQKTQLIRESLSSLAGSLPSGCTAYGLNQDKSIDAMIGRRTVEGARSANFQSFAG